LETNDIATARKAGAAARTLGGQASQSIANVGSRQSDASVVEVRTIAMLISQSGAFLATIERVNPNTVREARASNDDLRRRIGVLQEGPCG
jgi:hypothetical protein